MSEIAERTWNAAARLLLLALAIVCTFGFLRAALTIPNWAPLDPNEGWNAYHALAAMSGRALYPPPQSFMVNNYPPLSFYIVGALGRWIGDMIVAGRLISLASFALVTAEITALARIMRCHGWQAAFSAFLLAGVLLLTCDYVGMDDPQLLAHAISLSGLILLLRRPEKMRFVVASALLMATALFVKHNLIALPLAVTLWLFLYDRRNALRFVIAGMGFGIAGLCAFRIAYGVPLWQELLSARIYTLANLTLSLRTWFSWSIPVIIIAAALFWRHRRDEYVKFFLIYAIVAFLVGGIFSGGDGVDANVMFDADIALCLCCALALNRFAAARAKAMIAALCALSLGFGLWQTASPDMLRAEYWLHPLRAETTQAHSDIIFMRSRKGPALCETLAFCYWAGKPAQVDVYNVEEQLRAGVRTDQDLIHTLNARGYAVIQFDSLSPFALSPGIKKALLAHYRIQRSNDDGVFLIPR